MTAARFRAAETVCSLGDLSPRQREEWLKLTRKIEDALIGQSDLLDVDDGGVARHHSSGAGGAPAIEITTSLIIGSLHGRRGRAAG
ncbi:MAG TPA: hypothetical protein VFE63_08360 [Roseiarcus sp.]|nr:hypothetical protein [Roseiarcus sp.]